MDIGSIELIDFSSEQGSEFGFVQFAFPEDDLGDGAILEVVGEVGGGGSDLKDVVVVVSGGEFLVR